MVQPEGSKTSGTRPACCCKNAGAEFTATAKLAFSHHFDGEKTGLLMGMDYAYIAWNRGIGQLFLTQSICKSRAGQCRGKWQDSTGQQHCIPEGKSRRRQPMPFWVQPGKNSQRIRQGLLSTGRQMDQPRWASSAPARKGMNDGGVCRCGLVSRIDNIKNSAKSKIKHHNSLPRLFILPVPPKSQTG